MLAAIGILMPIVLLTCYISLTTKVKVRRINTHRRH